MYHLILPLTRVTGVNCRCVMLSGQLQTWHSVRHSTIAIRNNNGQTPSQRFVHKALRTSTLTSQYDESTVSCGASDHAWPRRPSFFGVSSGFLCNSFLSPDMQATTAVSLTGSTFWWNEGLHYVENSNDVFASFHQILDLSNDASHACRFGVHEFTF